MKTIKLVILTGTALVGLGQLVWASPRGGGAGFAVGSHFAGTRIGGHSDGPRMAPTFSGGARFSGRSIGGLSRAPQQFYYYRSAPNTAHSQQGLTRQLPNRPSTSYAGSRATTTGPQNRVGSVTRQKNRVGDSQSMATAVRRAVANHNVLARHDTNWHRDWDKHRAHFHHGVVFVFVNGFWWGLSPAYFPWDYYPYYAYGDYPYDYYSSPYDYYDYDDQSAYTDSEQYGSNSTVRAVQSELAKLGYYQGQIDGVAGDNTQAAIARYQEDHDLSVTGTVTDAILRSLGLTQKAS